MLGIGILSSRVSESHDYQHMIAKMMWLNDAITRRAYASCILTTVLGLVILCLSKHSLDWGGADCVCNVVM